MVDRISVELNNLRAAAGKMQSVISSLSNIDAALGSITGSMSGIWGGRARDKYFDDCKEIRTAATTFKEQLTERRTSLVQAMAVYERTERTVAGKVTDLSAGDIF
jgi:WXG100 family type VII secretion target